LRRLGATLIIALAIPFSIVTAVGFLYLAGRSLNVLTMLGLMLATGMLVDNAVVVLESIYQKLEKGMDHAKAARVGTQEVITAVSAATLTSVIIFVPLVFGEKSEYSIWLGHTGIAIILALLCSLFISLTLIPLGMARFLRIDVTRRERWQEQLGHGLRAVVLPWRRPAAESKPAAAAGSGRLMELYLRGVDWPLRHRYLVGLLLVPLAVAGSFWWLMNKVPNMTPEAIELRDERIEFKFSENFHYAKIEHDYVIPVERYLTANRERFRIKDVYSSYGNNWANVQIYFDKEHITYQEVPEIRRQISENLPQIPGAEITLGAQRGERNRTWISANLYGDDPDVLQNLAEEAKRRLQARADFAEVRTEIDNAEEEVQIRIHRDLARKFGISGESVSTVLGIVLRGRPVRGYRTSEGEVDLHVQIRPEDREDLEDLRAMVVHAGPDGTPVPLSQVADLDIQKVPARIARENRRTNTWVGAAYVGQHRDDGKKILTDIMDLLPYPPGYNWSFSFWTSRYDAENKDFLFDILLALFMVYFVMASLFESLAHPFAIMFSLPFALVGVAWFSYFTDSPFNVMAYVGSMVLIGIVVNNGIVLIDHVNNLRRKGLRRAEAIREGCRERLRPILMTASTTVVGLVPLAFGDSGMLGMQYFPMARTVMGGLLASTILTLVVLPTYYTLMDDFAVWLKRTWQESDPAAEGRSEAPAGD
jgi:HAE1 family hydrophobic/amphiphilic exporter-1